MSAPLRSKQGCWTCRLRKKKCDEGRPHCSTCESLSITCYGFGPKPDWMNNKEKEKAVVNSLKEIVKHTSRRKAATQYSKQRDPIIKIAPKSSSVSADNSSTSGSGSSPDHGVTPPSDHGSFKEDRVQDALLTNLSSPKHGVQLLPDSMVYLPSEQTVLLMHFLDNVFPLQFPLYKPGILEGGRGWVLALALRTKALYHALLALGAHSRTVLLTQLNHPSKVHTLVGQETSLEVCIQELNRLAQNSCPHNGLGVVAAVFQMVFYELYVGHGNSWKPHLRAAMNMFQRGHEQSFAGLGLDERARTILMEDRPLSLDESLVTEQIVAFRFLGGSMVWLDIISSITSGTTPNLFGFHSCVICSSSHIQLEHIMGCKNWAMLQIGRIAALYEQTSQALHQGQFDCTRFKDTLEDIGREIQCGSAQDALDGFSISDSGIGPFQNAGFTSPALITHIFAYMATIYLHLIAHGFQKLDMIDSTVSEVMQLLQTRISVALLPALICPLYMVACVARQEEEKQFFRNIFNSTPILDPTLNHRKRILPILEEIWRRRQARPSFAWKETFELTHDILLI
ncbi:fungal-specific transcription factor domain-containing protein [Bisporella sp. PMI_857]|nr:fungal-specific transcription factor domain-containing protein [Bisporella sp. PMI_857]